MKKVLSLLILSVLICGGCAQDTHSEVATELQDNAFAVVNGEPISQSDYRSFYFGNLAEMDTAQEQLIETYGEEEVANYENDVLDDLITQEVLLQYAAENDLAEIPEELAAQLSEQAKQYLDSIKLRISDQINAEGASGVLINKNAEIEKRYAGYLKKYDLSEETVLRQLERQYIIEKVNQSVMNEFELPDNAVKQYYDENLELQREFAEQNPEQAAEMFIQNQNEVQIYIPESISEDTRFVKHILITPPAEYSEAASAAAAQGDEETAEQLAEEGMEEAKLLAQDVLEELNNGVDFDELVSLYNEDPGVQANPDGYLIYEGAPYVENFLNEGLALKNIGDYTKEPVETEYGYHIIMYASNPVAGAAPLSEVEDQILPIVESAAETQFWLDTVDAMVENADIERVVLTVSDIS